MDESGSDQTLTLVIRLRDHPQELDRFDLLYQSLIRWGPSDLFDSLNHSSYLMIISPTDLLKPVQRILQKISPPKLQLVEDHSINPNYFSQTDLYFYVEADVICVNRWTLPDILRSSLSSSFKLPLMCGRVYPRTTLLKSSPVVLMGPDLRIKSNSLIRTIQTPEELFQAKPKSAKGLFWRYPRSAQICPAIIADQTIIVDQTTIFDQPMVNRSKKNLPLISCVMVTKDRLTYVKTAIQCFLDQTYPNLELIIISDCSSDLENYLESLNCPRIKLTQINDDLTLGELRNLSLTQARGKYICQWDDDDWYHSSRVSLQYQALIKEHADVVLLSQWMLISPRTGQYGLSSVRSEGWEGSILARADIPLTYPSLKRGEDRQLIQTLRQNYRIHVITEPGYWMLYGYLIHQNNTWTHQHFQNILIQRIPLSRVWVSPDYSIEAIAQYLAHRHHFGYHGYREEDYLVVDMLIHRINTLWEMIKGSK